MLQNTSTPTPEANPDFGQIFSQLRSEINRLNETSNGINYLGGILKPYPPEKSEVVACQERDAESNEIIPMLRYRDGGQWTWPSDAPVGSTYNINGLEDLTNSESEVSLIIALTADPEVTNIVANELFETKGIKTIKLLANSQYLGNGAIGHPKDGMGFTKDIQALLHRLADRHGVSRVHVLPCASNAACVFFGQAYDKHHPELLIYDFVSKSMAPQILIGNDGVSCELSSVS